MKVDIDKSIGMILNSASNASAEEIFSYAARTGSLDEFGYYNNYGLKDSFLISWSLEGQAYAGNTIGISRLLAEVGETPSSEPPPSGYASCALKCPTQEKRNVVVISVKTAPSFMELLNKASAKAKISRSAFTKNAVNVVIANPACVIPAPIKNDALVKLLTPLASQLNQTATLLNTINKAKDISQEELEETLFDIVDSVKAGKDLLSKTKLSILKGGCCEN